MTSPLHVLLLALSGTLVLLAPERGAAARTATTPKFFDQSIRPLLSEMRTQLKAKDYRISTAIETIVLSKQFREIRGRKIAHED